MNSFNTDKLNPEQALAVAHDKGPLLILAGAGSGKTRVLVSRVASLISQSSKNPPGICVLTFTNKSATELKGRVRAQIGTNTQTLWAGTFHAFGLQLLRKYHRKLELNPKFQVADTTDCQAIVRDILVNMTNSGKNSFQIDKLLNIVQTYKQNPNATVIEEEDYLTVAKYLLPKYESRKRALGVVDFEDLLSLPIELLENHPEVFHKVQDMFQYYMVDEFQDTNEVQMQLLHILVKDHKNLVVVGDDDQAIYGWRGARVKNILDFPKNFDPCKVIQLDRNYRSSASILTMANNIIVRNKDRHGKILKAEALISDTERPEVFVFESDEEEVEQVAKLIEDFHRDGKAYKDIAVLYRSNGQGGFLETELRQARIPYSITGGTAFFDRKEIKDILAYLSCILTPKEISLRRIINVPPRGVGDETIKNIEDYVLGQAEEMSFIKALRLSGSFEFLSQSARHGIRQFLEELGKLKSELLGNEDINWEQRLPSFFIEIGYKKYLGKFSKNDEALNRRWMSVEIFARVFNNFINKKENRLKGLQEFIDMMLLRDYDNDPEGEDKDEVQLMTMHAAKGLEFPVVFIIGVEEDLIPHHRLGSDIDEERRLFYVGVTRAQERLLITHTRARKRYGKMREVLPSRFLVEVDPSLYQHFANGFRGVAEDVKDQMLADMQAKLALFASKQKIEPDLI